MDLAKVAALTEEQLDAVVSRAHKVRCNFHSFTSTKIVTLTKNMLCDAGSFNKEQRPRIRRCSAATVRAVDAALKRF